MSEEQVYHRYEGYTDAERTIIDHYHFTVARRTPKGVWLKVWGKEKFVLDTGQKRFAYPTIKEARASFIARKKRHIRLLSAQLNAAEILLDKALAGEWDE